MKKILFILICSLFTAGIAAAQTATISPAKFTAEDEITIQVNVAGTVLDGLDVYLWAFSNAGDALTNGAWTSSDEKNKMTKLSPNVWSIKVTGTTFFGKAPSELKTLGFLFKAKDGSGSPEKKSRDFGPYNYDPLTFTESQFRSFPSKAAQSDIITIFMNQSLAATTSVQRMTSVKTVTLTAFDATDAPVGVAVTKNVDSYAGKLATYAFIPNKTFTVPAGVKIAKIKFIFKGTGLDASGAEINVDANEGEVILLDF